MGRPPLHVRTDVGLCITADEATLLRHERNVEAASAIMGDGAAGVVIPYKQNGSVCRGCRSRTRSLPERTGVLLRIFTPAAELPFAGHPTLGSCQGTALGRRGRVHLTHDDDGRIWTAGATITCIRGDVEI